MTEERVDLPCPWCKGRVRHVVGCPSPPLDDHRWDERKKERAVIDHEYTDEIVCPYCGAENEAHEFEDGKVYTEEESRLDCGSCEKIFASYCHVSYSFSTHEVDLEAEKREREKMRRELQEEREARRAVAAEWLPGTRVRVKEDAGYADFLRGREGVVPNKELCSHGDVNVTLDATAEHKGYDTYFRPGELERL